MPFNLSLIALNKVLGNVKRLRIAGTRKSVVTHNVTGNGKRDGLKITTYATISSRAPNHGEGSTTKFDKGELIDFK